MLKSLLLLLFLSVFTIACKEPEPESLPPQEIVANSAERMIELEGFHFAVDVSGKPAFLDVDQNFSLAAAEGFFVSPDKAIAAVRVLAPGLVTEIEILSIGQEQWLSGLVSDDWTALPPEWGFNPAILVDAESGILSALTADLEDLHLDGISTLDDGPAGEFYWITGVLDGRHISEMSQGLLGPQPLEVQLWIAPETYELYRAVITDPRLEDSDEATVWQIDFGQFDETVDITAPSS